MSRRRRALAALLLAAALAPRPAAGAPSPCGLKGVSRVVAVGDVHGSYDRFVGILQASGLVDAQARWTGGRAHLVQVGDVLDRGAEGPKVVDLLMRLEGQAAKAGGRVIPLLGNHEVMNMLGDLRYVSAEEYRQFRTPDSERLRSHLYERSMDRARSAAKARGEKFDETAFRAKFNEEAPLGWIERKQALAADGRLGEWLRKHDTVATIDGVVFVHGGLTPEVAALGCEAINDRVRKEIGADVEKTMADPKATLAAGENGPLWFRGLARGETPELEALADGALRPLAARAIVIGHTVTGTGRIEVRVGGRVIMIDAGMTDGYGGHAAALEIDGQGRMTAIYPDRREPLDLPAAADASAPPVGRSLAWAATGYDAAASH
ncbi:MAG: metallophosphoesterase [Vicinamibacteria bacterium]